jgi:competence protein ComEC
LLLLLPRGTPLKSLGVIGFLPLFIYQHDKPKTGEFWFRLLDVGQGLSAVIQTKNHTLLFDTGAHFSDSFNAGEHIIVPYLKQNGLRTIDKVIVSHGDNDHIGGLARIINQLTVKEIISNEMIDGALPCIAGQFWSWDQVRFEVLHPSPNDSFDGNNRSCILKVSATIGSVLLTGDIEKEAEQALIARYPHKLNSTLLVAPHHGSKTSSTSAFIERVSPEVVMFATGYLNRFNHPHPKVLARYEQTSQTFNTAMDGSLLVQFTEHGIQPTMTWRKKSQKIWTAQLTK